MNLLQKTALRLFPLYIITITWLSLSSGSIIREFGSWDKLEHGIAYTIFALFCGFMSQHLRQFWLAMLFCCIYGIFIELLQSFTPSRTPSVFDFLANMTGLFAGFIILRSIHQFIPLASQRLQGQEKN